MIEMTWTVKRDEAGQRVLNATWTSMVKAQLPLAS